MIRAMKAPFSRLPAVKLRLDQLWPMVAFFGVFFFLSTHPIRPHDFWWHLRAGQEIVATGRIPAVDQFSFTMQGQPYDNYAAYWLVEAAFYLLYRVGSPALVIFVHTLTVSVAYGLLLMLCWRVSNSWRVAALNLLFAAALGFSDWNIRPQAIAFPLFVLFLWAIADYQRRSRAWLLALFPLGMLIWVNSHGSFVLGLVLLGLWLADRAWQALRRWLAGDGRGALDLLAAPAVALAAALLACLANPRGPGMLAYLRDLSSNPAVRSLAAEWGAPTLQTVGGALFLLGLALAALLLALSPRRPTIFEAGTFLVFGLLGLQAARNSVWFGLAMAPVLARHLAAISQQRLTRTSGAGWPALNLALASVLLVIALLSLPWFKHLLPLPERRAGLVSQETPVAATEFLLAERPPEPLFHEMGYGSYLIWAAYPQYRVFVDPRIELYPLSLWLEYLAISTAQEGWEDRLQEHGINTLLLDRVEQPALTQSASRSDRWQVAYDDGRAVAFVRSDHSWWRGRTDLPARGEAGG
jgi:hypothetical protein